MPPDFPVEEGAMRRSLHKLIIHMLRQIVVLINSAILEHDLKRFGGRVVTYLDQVR